MAREAIPNVAVPAKINPDETFFFFEFLMADSCDFPYSSTTLIKWLPLTAAVTFNDVMAAGIMRILHQRGVQLPQQLSIVGFDDVVLARYLYPALTTMHYPVEQMARCAAQLAIQLYQGITPQPSSNHFNAELVIRDSVAPYFSR